MEKDFEIVELFELYKGLLTEKQRETFALHYLYDLSLAEIAEQEGTARQSVHDAIRKVKTKLTEYESVLRLKEKFDGVVSALEQSLDKELCDKLKEIIGR
jgi:predicted DNA-binding protein YlxM (UPF0122 family)